MEHNTILQTTALSHRFASGEQVLNDVNLRVPAGSVYGFLGPNGAGKTTTLRLILGLLEKQIGTVTIFGKSFADHRIETLQQIGAMIESPSIYSHLTATENLEVMRRIYRSPKERIPAVLKMVGLADAKNKRAGRFSLGMKQRLSIALALLHEPSLLILDEPTNGLDPNGMIEVRQLLQSLNREQGITILLSSHLLAEMEKMVSHVGIIHHGRLLFQGKLEELRSQGHATLHIPNGVPTGSSFLVINTGNNARAKEMLDEKNYAASINDGKLLLSMLHPAEVAGIVRELVKENVPVYEISQQQNDLETIFMDMITNQQ